MYLHMGHLSQPIHSRTFQTDRELLVGMTFFAAMLPDAFVWLFTAMLFVIIYLALFLYLRIYLMVRRSTKTVGQSGNQTSVKYATKSTAKTMFIVLTVLVVCWTPITFVNFWVSFSSVMESPDLKRLTSWCILLGYSNSMMNPIIYSFRNERFRKMFFAATICMSVKSRSDSSNAYHGEVQNNFQTI